MYRSRLLCRWLNISVTITVVVIVKNILYRIVIGGYDMFAMNMHRLYGHSVELLLEVKLLICFMRVGNIALLL